jgi:CRISPR-associated protein Csy1
MMTNVILQFLGDRKQAKLNKPGDATVEEIENDFRVETWVASASVRAGQLSMVTHPGKFSHPDARISPILYEGKAEIDGYVHSGNLKVQTDVLGNAAALDVYTFLSLRLSDGKTIFEHFEGSTEVLRDTLGVDVATFEQWRTGFLKIKSVDNISKTDGKIKQVYFPVGDGYHLLSILTPSGVVTLNRARMQQSKFSDEAKSARDARKSAASHDTGFNDIAGYLQMKFGGTKPQNISKLNSVNGGEAWLLPSLPPSFSPKYTYLPRRDFFESLALDDSVKLLFATLHRLFTTDYNNINIREGRKKCLESIFEWVFDRATFYQQQPAGWTSEGKVHLPHTQKLWLDQGLFGERESHLGWTDEIVAALVTWTVVTYRRLRKNAGDAVSLGQVEEAAFNAELREYARRMGEDLI